MVNDGTGSGKMHTIRPPREWLTVEMAEQLPEPDVLWLPYGAMQ